MRFVSYLRSVSRFRGCGRSETPHISERSPEPGVAFVDKVEVDPSVNVLRFESLVSETSGPAGICAMRCVGCNIIDRDGTEEGRAALKKSKTCPFFGRVETRTGATVGTRLAVWMVELLAVVGRARRKSKPCGNIL